MVKFAEIQTPKGVEIDLESTIKEEWVLRYTPRYRNVYRRGRSGLSRRAAIRAFCVQCMGYHPGDVPGCTAPGCPLFAYRLRG